MAGNVTQREGSGPPGVRGVGNPEGLQALRCVEKTEAAVQQAFR